MSKWLDFSDAIQTRLVTELADLCGPDVPEEERVEVIVDRQLDISTVVAINVGKAKGACITILWLGGKNPAPDQATLTMGGSYRISVIGVPTINDSTEGRVPLDELVEQVCQALHGWQASDRPTRLRETLRVLEVDLAPDPHLLTYEINADVKRL